MVRPHARRRARALALQAIYQWQFVPGDAVIIEEQFTKDINSKKIDVEYFVTLLHGVISNVEKINEIMRPLLDRTIDELDGVELAVLRLAIYELVYCLDVPYKAVINEALELAKDFGSVEGYKYVNGILDKVARSVRTEIQK